MWRLLFCLCICTALFSAEAKWEFPSSVVPNVRIRVPIKITNFPEQISQWDQPKMEHVNWYAIQRAGHFTSIINGVKTQEQTVLVTVSFSQVGEYTIPPVTFSARSGAQVKTEAVTVKVQKSNFEANGECVAETRCSSTQVVPGEVFILHYQISTPIKKRYAINNSLGLQIPEDVIQVSDVKIYDSEKQYSSNGEMWEVRKYSIELKCTKPGSYTFSGQQEYFSINRRFMHNSYERAGSTPIKPTTVTVIHLPTDGQPNNFTGLIGAVDLDASVDRERIPLGKNIQLQITASNGQVDMLSGIKVPPIDGLTIYEGDYDVSEDEKTKTYYWTLVPQREGNFIIPAITVPYFDSKDRQYRSIKTKPLALTVIPGKQRDLNMVGTQTNTTSSPLLNTSGAGLALPSPLYGDASAAWSHRSIWFALIIGILAGIGISWATTRRSSDTNPGPSIKKSLIKSLEENDANTANQIIHQLIPHLSAAGKSQADALIKQIEAARFGGGKIDNSFIQQATALELA